MYLQKKGCLVGYVSFIGIAHSYTHANALICKNESMDTSPG